MCLSKKSTWKSFIIYGLWPLNKPCGRRCWKFSFLPARPLVIDMHFVRQFFSGNSASILEIFHRKSQYNHAASKRTAYIVPKISQRHFVSLKKCTLSVTCKRMLSYYDNLWDIISIIPTKRDFPCPTWVIKLGIPLHCKSANKKDRGSIKTATVSL